MKHITPIYIPDLHREFAPASLPGAVLFLCPGLDEPAEGRFQPENLPFSGASARAVLREMLELGSSLSRGGKNAPGEELRSLESGIRATLTPRGPGGIGAAEKTEIARFAGAEPAAARFDDGAAELIRAQKILLLHWELEENLLEIRKTEAALAGQDQRLFAALRGPEDDGNGAAPESVFTPPPVAWRILLEAAAPFLPAEALLFTAHPETRDALMELAPPANLPPAAARELADRPGFAPLLPVLRYAEVRLGDLVGGASKAAARPWLNNIYKFAILPG